MIPVAIPNRPFATDVITGLQLPDGIFEATLGKQRINAHLKNIGAAAINNAQVYIEGVSHPGLIVTPATHVVPSLGAGVARLLGWEADFSAVPPGEHHVSFVAEGAGGDRTRVIKKIFVTRVQFDPVTATFSAPTPQGIVTIQFADLIKPKEGCCGRRSKVSRRDRKVSQFPANLSRLFGRHDPDFEFCPPGYLPHQMDVTVTSTPPFAGQYGDLPYQDPWWKVVFCIIAVSSSSQLRSSPPRRAVRSWSRQVEAAGAARRGTVAASRPKGGAAATSSRAWLPLPRRPRRSPPTPMRVIQSGGDRTIPPRRRASLRRASGSAPSSNTKRPLRSASRSRSERNGSTNA